MRSCCGLSEERWIQKLVSESNGKYNCGRKFEALLFNFGIEHAIVNQTPPTISSLHVVVFEGLISSSASNINVSDIA